MAVGSRFAVCFGSCIALAFLGYFLHIPMPETITERTKIEITDVVLRLAYAYPARLFAWMGYPYLKLYWTRNVLNYLSYGLGYWSLEDPDLEIIDREFAGVPVRVYVPKGERANDGAMIFVHGGGFVLMNVASYDLITRYMAKQSKMVTISVEYRLAPEHVFPAGLEDVENATIYFLQKGYKDYGVDPKKVGLIGDSAGGNLVAVTSQRLRSRADVQTNVKFQGLFYPVVQYTDFQTPSYQKYWREYSGSAFLDPASLARWLMMYLGVHPTSERVAAVLQNNHTTREMRKESMDVLSALNHSSLPQTFLNDGYQTPPDTPGQKDLYNLLKPYLLDPNFSPLMQKNLTGLPATMIQTCEFDILRDEGFWFARRLKEAGNKVVHKHYETGFHAMLNFYTELPLAQAAIQHMLDFVADSVKV